MFNRLQTVFESFHSHNVRYLVIGGIAVVLHGVPRATFDLDILIDPTEENARRLIDALRGAGFGTAFLVEPTTLLANEITIFKDKVRIDVQTSTPGITFDSAWPRRQTMHYKGQEFPVLGKVDLMASKRAAGRPKDLEDLRVLELQDESGTTSDGP